MRREPDPAEDLRAALRRSAEVAGDGTGCPEAERLVSSARKDLPRDENAAIVLHIATCTSCAAAWRVARDVAGVPLAAPSEIPRAVFPAGWIRWAAAAAVGLAAIVGGISVLGPEPETPAVYREQEDGTIRSLVPETEPIPRGDFLLRWSAAADGATYDLVVADARMRTLARVTDHAGTEVRVPGAALAELEPGSRVYWRVSARLPNGRTLESATFLATVR